MELSTFLIQQRKNDCICDRIFSCIDADCEHVSGSLTALSAFKANFTFYAFHFQQVFEDLRCW